MDSCSQLKFIFSSYISFVLFGGVFILFQLPLNGELLGLGSNDMNGLGIFRWVR